MLFVDQMLVPLIVAACCFVVTRRLSTNSVNNRCLNGSSHEIRIVGIQNCNTACAHPRLKIQDPSHSTMRVQGRSGNYTSPERTSRIGCRRNDDAAKGLASPSLLRDQAQDRQAAVVSNQPSSLSPSKQLAVASTTHTHKLLSTQPNRPSWTSPMHCQYHPRVATRCANRFPS